MPDVIDPLVTAAVLFTGLVFGRLVANRRAMRRHGGGAAGFFGDTLIQLVPAVPLGVVLCVLFSVLLDGEPAWPWWAVGLALIPAMAIAAVLSGIGPFQTASARLRAATQAAESAGRF